MVFGKQKKRVYDEKEEIRTVREALYSALSGDYVVPLRAEPKARKFIPLRSRVSLRTAARCRYWTNTWQRFSERGFPH